MSDPVKPAISATSWADEEEEYEDGYDPNAVEPEPEPVQLPATPSHLSRGQLSRQSSAQSQGTLSRQSSQGSVNTKPVPNNPPYKAFFGNLPFRFQTPDLQAHFQGIIPQTVSWFYNDENRHNGRCTAEFETREQLMNALQKDGATIDNRYIRVDVAAKGDRSNRSYGAGASQDERNYQSRDSRDSRDSRGGQQRQWENRNERSEHGGRGYGGYDRERSGYQNERRDNRDTRQNDRPRREVSAPRRDSDAERDRPAPLTRETSSTSSVGGDLPSGANTPAAGRPKLKLAPRTITTPTAAAAEIQDTKGIFGGARPTSTRDALSRTESSGSIQSDSPVASPANANQTESNSHSSQNKTESSSSPSNTVRLVEGPLTSIEPPNDIKSQSDRRPTYQQRGGRNQQSSRHNDRNQTQSHHPAEENDWQQRGGNSKSNSRAPRTVGRGGAAAPSNAPKKQVETDEMSKSTNAFGALALDDD